jgi:hypothetical protein
MEPSASRSASKFDEAQNLHHLLQSPFLLRRRNIRTSTAWYVGTAIEALALVGASVSFLAAEPPLSDVLIAVFILGGMLLSWWLSRTSKG